MFTAEEIRQITFEKVMRGYRTEDVEAFIENIADEFDSLEKEKKDLEEKLYVLAEKVEQYKQEEESIKTTLINAQRLGESIVADAKTKADTVIREATIKKNDIISSAYAEIEGTDEVLHRLKKEVSDFKRTVLGLYKSHIEILGTLPEEKEKVVEEPVEETEEAETAETTEVEESTESVEKEVIEQEAPVEEPTVEIETEDKFKSVSTLFGE